MCTWSFLHSSCTCLLGTTVRFSSGVKSVFSEGCETFFNQLPTKPGRQNLFWRGIRKTKCTCRWPNDQIPIFVSFTFILFGKTNTLERALETMNRHMLRILKRFITCARVPASSILKNIMSVRSGTHLKYTRFLFTSVVPTKRTACCFSFLFPLRSTYCSSISSETEHDYIPF